MTFPWLGNPELLEPCELFFCKWPSGTIIASNTKGNKCLLNLHVMTYTKLHCWYSTVGDLPSLDRRRAKLILLVCKGHTKSHSPCWLNGELLMIPSNSAQLLDDSTLWLGFRTTHLYVGTTEPVIMKRAFSCGSWMRLLMIIINWATVMSAGTRYFRLSMHTMFDPGTFSTITW